MDSNKEEEKREEEIELTSKEQRWLTRPSPPSVISADKGYMLHLLEQQSMGLQLEKNLPQNLRDKKYQEINPKQESDYKNGKMRADHRSQMRPYHFHSPSGVSAAVAAAAKPVASNSPLDHTYRPNVYEPISYLSQPTRSTRQTPLTTKRTTTTSSPKGTTTAYTPFPTNEGLAIYISGDEEPKIVVKSNGKIS